MEVDLRRDRVRHLSRDLGRRRFDHDPDERFRTARAHQHAPSGPKESLLLTDDSGGRLDEFGSARSGGIDADSWRRIRDTLISAQLLKRLDRGHYLLSRDLHHFTLAELADLLRAEPTYALAEQAMPWQKTAAALLQDNLDQESSLLATPRAELFATAQSPSA